MEKFIVYAETKSGQQIDLPADYLAHNQKINPYYTEARWGVHHAYTSAGHITDAAKIIGISPKKLRVVCIERVATN